MKQRSLFICLWFFTSVCVNAETPLFVTEILPPLQTLENGKLAGIHSKKIFNALHKSRLGEVAVEAYPWARAYKLALERKNTFIFSMIRTPEREDKFIWVKKLSADNFAFYARRPGDRFKIKQLSDAKKWRTVALRQDPAFQVLLQSGFNEKHHLLIVNNLDAAFQTFFSNRVELISTTNEIMEAMAKKHGVDANLWERIWEIPDLSNGYYLAANKETDIHLIETLRKSLP